MMNNFSSSPVEAEKVIGGPELTTLHTHSKETFPPEFSHPTDKTDRHKNPHSFSYDRASSNSNPGNVFQDGSTENSRNQNDIYVYLASLLIAVGGFLHGYDTGITSGALIYMRDDFRLDSKDQEIVVSATLLGAWIFAIAAGPVTDKFGRKIVILISSIVFVIGSSMLALAHSYVELVTGRFVLGAAIGLSSVTVPMYIAEVAPSRIRGQLVVISVMCITGGQFSASMIAYAFSYNKGNNGWRYMLGIGAVPAAVQLTGFLFMPESPRWLVKQGRYAEAKQVLAKVNPPSVDLDWEFNNIKVSCDQAKKYSASSWDTLKRIIKNQPVRKALFMGSMLQLLQQVVGINTVMYYSASIIEMSGVRSKQMAILLSIGTSFTNFFFTLVGFYLVERSGRRRLTLFSLFGAIMSLLILGSGFLFANYNTTKVMSEYKLDNSPCDVIEDCYSCSKSPECGYCFSDGPTFGSISNSFCLRASPDNEHSLVGNCTQGTTLNYTWASNWCPSAYSWIIVVGMVLYLMCFAPGMGPMPWTINSEIYPLWARSLCLSCTTSVNWISNLMVSLTFLSLINAITSHGAFYLYAFISSVGFIYLVIVLPETRGKTLEELEHLFADKDWLNSDKNRRLEKTISNDQHSASVVSAKL